METSQIILFYRLYTFREWLSPSGAMMYPLPKLRSVWQNAKPLRVKRL